MDSFVTNLIFGKSENNTVEHVLVSVILLWSLLWKGIALWHSSKKEEKYWFVAILLLNTAGILEIAYLCYFSKFKVKLDKKSLTGFIGFFKK
jgi:heme A synthase